jgi:hypothetical protein
MANSLTTLICDVIVPYADVFEFSTHFSAQAITYGCSSSVSKLTAVKF